MPTPRHARAESSRNWRLAGVNPCPLAAGIASVLVAMSVSRPVGTPVSPPSSHLPGRPDCLIGFRDGRSGLHPALTAHFL